jgi:ligand-binding sensor domain-containing protein
MSVVHVAADVGDWRTFTPLVVNDIAVIEGQVWAATGGGVFRSATANSEPLVISTTEGLSDNNIQSAIADGRGNIWFGTEEGGLMSFSVFGNGPPVMKRPLFLTMEDGEPRPEIISISGLDVLEDTLYIAHAEGITTLDLRSGLVIENAHHLGGSATNRYQAVNFVVRTQDQLWAGVGGGLAWTEVGGNLRIGDNWTRWSEVASHTAVDTSANDLVEFQGRVYVASNRGVYHLEGLVAQTVSPQIPTHQLAKYDDYLWAATDGGLGRFDGTNWQYMPQISDTVLAVSASPDFGVVVATENSGIQRLRDSAGTEISTVPGVQFPPFEMFTHLAVDTASALWVSSGAQRSNEGKGLYRYDGNIWEHWHHTNNRMGNHSSGIVSLIADPMGRVWAGGHGKGMIDVLRAPPDGPQSHLSLNTSNSIVRGFTWDPSFGVFRDFAVDRRGYMWIAVDGRILQAIPLDVESGNTGGGIRLADPFIEDGDILPLEAWQVTVDGNGVVWVGMRSSGLGGLYLFDPGEDIELASDDQFVDRISSSEPVDAPTVHLSDDNITAMLTDREGRVWVGTSNGLMRYDGTYDRPTNTLSFPPPRRFTKSQGLPHNWITALLVDSVGTVWVGTSAGLAQITQSDNVLDMTDQKLVSLEIASLAYDHRNGYVYIGTRSGLSRYEAYPPAGERGHLTVDVLDNPYSLQLRQAQSGVVAEGDPLRFNVPVGSSVAVYSLTGELVWRTVAEGRQVEWDGSNLGGFAVASGVYLAVVERDGRRSVSKLAVVRSRR